MFDLGLLWLICVTDYLWFFYAVRCCRAWVVDGLDLVCEFVGFGCIWLLGGGLFVLCWFVLTLICLVVVT